MKMTFLFSAGFLALAQATVLWAAEPAAKKPKYGPEATRISLSHEYFRSHPAPDYWVISPYYTGQQNDASCSVASVAMILNAARADQSLTADDELVTQPALLTRTGNQDWIKAVTPGPGAKGVTLDQLGTILEQSLRAYGFRNFKIRVVHVTDTGASALRSVQRDLAENERSNRNFIVANFIQGVYTGDADVGHIAPLGAYDAAKKRVLIMDPDRKWYEPYWVSLETFLRGMATQDRAAGKTRGYVRIDLGSH